MVLKTKRLIGGRKYIKKNIKEGKGFFGNIFRKGRNFITDRLYKRTTYNNFVRQPNLPSNKLLQKIAEDSYSKTTIPFIGEYENIFKNDTLNIYKNETLKIIIIGVRGTASGGDALADLKIANGSLNTSIRYKNDLQTILQLQSLYLPSQYQYYGSGHSLAGAILDLFLKGGYIKQAVSYNPAVEKAEMSNSNNLRIYNDDDALYNLLGKYANNTEVRKNKNKISNPIINTLNAHKMTQFEGGVKIVIKTEKQRKLKSVFDRMNRSQLIFLVRDYNLQQKIIGYYRHPKDRLIYLINKYMKFENGDFVNRNDGEAVKYDPRAQNPDKINVGEEQKKINNSDKDKSDKKEKKRLERNEKAKLKRLEKKKKEEPKKEEPKKEDDDITEKVDRILKMNPAFSKERSIFYKKHYDAIKKFTLKFVKDLPLTIRKNFIFSHFNMDIKKDKDRIIFLQKKAELNPRNVIEQYLNYEDYNTGLFDDIADFFETLMKEEEPKKEEPKKEEPKKEEPKKEEPKKEEPKKEEPNKKLLNEEKAKILKDIEKVYKEIDLLYQKHFNTTRRTNNFFNQFISKQKKEYDLNIKLNEINDLLNSKNEKKEKEILTLKDLIEKYDEINKIYYRDIYYDDIIGDKNMALVKKLMKEYDVLSKSLNKDINNLKNVFNKTIFKNTKKELKIFDELVKKIDKIRSYSNWRGG